MACLPTKLNFLANGCVLGQNARKKTPFKIQFYCQDNIILLSAPFLNLINGIGFFFFRKFHGNSIFLVNGCSLGPNARKGTPFKIQFYCQGTINLLSAPFLNHINGIGFFLFISSPLCLLAGNLQPDFQIAVTHSILKLKSILRPPDKMT